MFQPQLLTILSIVVLVSPLLGVLGSDDTQKCQTVRLHSGQHVSENVTVSDAEFQLSVSSNWALAANEDQTSVSISLKITNKSAAALQFDTFDTITVILKNANGDELQLGRGRYYTIIPIPIVIAKCASQVVNRSAIIKRSEMNSTIRVIGTDGAGGSWWFNELKAGEYTISMKFENSLETWKRIRQIPNDKNSDIETIPVWSGSATTKQMTISIR